MKKIVFILSIILTQIANAQNTNFAKYLANKKAKLTFPTYTVNSNILWKQSIDFSSIAKQYLLNNIAELQISNTNLKLVHTYQSLIGTHFQFNQKYNGSVIYQSNIKIAINTNGKIINVLNDLVDLRNRNLPTDLLNQNQIWVFNGSELIAASTIIVGNKEQIISIENELLFENIKSLGMGKTDTIAQIKIFNPDPLTTARSPYEAPYLNYNKADTPALNNERKDVALNLKIDSLGNYLAENNYVLIKDIFDPAVAPFMFSNKDSLLVTRNTDVFKQEMALYHINEYQKYIQSIGFTNLKNQLWVDALGGFGEDSRFEFSGPNPYLILAIGGIPDAEDADVITHEYTHAIGFYIAPNTVDGEERIGIDEANSDIMAVLYSRKLSDYNWRKVFNWDGNTWGGRTTLNTKNYVDNYASERYSLSAIWSGAITDIAEEIGIDTTVTLLFTAMASYQSNMTIPTFAQLFLQADSLLYNKYHFGTLKNSFFNRKLIKSVSINEVFDASHIKIINSEGFANNNEPLKIQAPTNDNFDVLIYNLQGKLVLTLNNQQTNCSINPDMLNMGMYILNIAFGNKSFNFKIAKY